MADRAKIKQEPPRVLREVLAKVVKAEDLEVHTCRVVIGGVTVLDIRDYVPSAGEYGRGTSLPWNTETLKVLNAALREASRATPARTYGVRDA